MNYIGSKNKLSSFIKSTIHDVVGKDLSDQTFCDLFAGTGIVGRTFKTEVKEVISNDIEYYSYVLNKNYIENHELIVESVKHIDILNQITPIDSGFIFNNYCLGGSQSERLYFSDENGKKIDAIRQQIQSWKNKGTTSSKLHYFLLASLIESADKIANTASVYGAYLKKIKKSAQKSIFIQPANFDYNSNSHKVFNEDSNELIKNIQGDILYLDPPYNSRQYGANYHLLNTIALYDNDFIPKGKTGLRDYKKSKYCSKRTVHSEFENLIKNAKFKYIFLSYNNEGLMSLDDIKSIMTKYGTYNIVSTKYQRFKADKDKNRNHSATETREYIHILEK